MSAQLDERVREINRALGAHAGGIEVAAVADASVTIRYTGMCTGCPFRPVTTAATVRPALLDLPEISSVSVEGSRISQEAEERLGAALRRWYPAPQSPASAGD